MDSMEKELALAYHEIEKEVKAQADNMASLLKKLSQAQKERDKATANLASAEREANSNSLTTVTAIEKARKNVQYAKYAAEDHAQAVNNLEDVIENAGELLNKLEGELRTQRMVIFRNVLVTKAEAIRAVSGDLLNDFNVIHVAAFGHVAFDKRAIPKALHFMTTDIDRQKTEKKILDEFLNNH